MSAIQYFLGANTPGGFTSLYHEITDPDVFRTVYILKSGPGSGKSTLMRKVERLAREAGHPTVEILCSGDPDSLDGVILPDLQAAVVDGTAPHVIEPSCPGVVERYIDLSFAYDRPSLQPHKDAIRAAFSTCQGHYRRAYRCLGAAGELRQNITDLLDGEAVQQKLARRAAGIASRELHRPPTGEGRLSHRYLTALSCQGTMALWETVSAQADTVYELQATYGLGRHLLNPLLTAGLAAGHDAVACPDPMAPGHISHLIFPGLSLAFVSTTPEYTWPKKAARRIRVDAMADANLLRTSRPRLRFTRRVAAALLEDGLASLAQAKAAHDDLETLYHPYVDFASVEQAADQVASELLS